MPRQRRAHTAHHPSTCAAAPASAASPTWPAAASPPRPPTPLLSLAPGEVHLWWADADDPALTGELVAWYAAHYLTPAEAAAAGGERARVLARALVRATLARYCASPPTSASSPPAAADPLSLTFTAATRGGKPALHPACNPAGVEFNLTHAGALAGVAVGRAGSGVGLDAEAAGRAPRAGAAALAARHFSAPETAALAAIAAAEGPDAANAEFVRLWTLKEAFVKATGEGIRGAGLAVGGGSCGGGADPATPAAVTQGLASFTISLEADTTGRAAARALEAALPGLPGVGGRARVGRGDPTLCGPAAAVRSIRLASPSADASAWRFLLMRPVPGYVAALCVRKEEGGGGGGGGGGQPSAHPLRARAWLGLPGRAASPLPSGAAGLACSL